MKKPEYIKLTMTILNESLNILRLSFNIFRVHSIYSDFYCDIYTQSNM